jgi:hypothetical protein
MRLTSAEIGLADATVATVDVGQLAVGPMSVGSLVLDGTRVELSTGAAQLRNLRVTVTLAMALDWEVSVSIPVAGNFDWNGTIVLGSHSLTVGVGDVNLPGLESLSLDLATIDVSDLSAVVGPLQDVHLGALTAHQLKVTGVVAPVPEFQLVGLGLGGLSVNGLDLPGASVEAISIGSIKGGDLPVPTMTLPGLQFPEAAVGDVRGGGLDVNGTSNPVGFRADAGVLKVTLRVTPSARTRADEFRLSGIRSSGSVQSLRLSDVVLPFEMTNLTLSQLGVTSIQVPTLQVS